MEQDQLTRRVAVLGASNVTLGLPVIVDLLRRGWEDSCEVVVGHGHGRSYGTWTHVAVRGLPGHNECPLIKSPSEGQSFHVLLTDIGNDLVYGANVPQIAAWVREIAEKLTDLGAEVLMTELPLTSVRNLTKARFLTFRTVFFPASGLQYPEVLDLAEKLNEHVQSICEDVGGTLIQPLPEWYGLDPIHIRKRHRAAAWAHIFQKFSGWSGKPDSAISVTDRCRLRFTRPVHDKWFGRESTNVGICHLSDGTKVQFF